MRDAVVAAGCIVIGFLVGMCLPTEQSGTYHQQRETAQREQETQSQIRELIRLPETRNRPINSPDTQAETKEPNNDTPCWCAVLTNPDWVLVLVTAATFGAIIWQAVLTRRSVTIARGQLDVATSARIYVDGVKAVNFKAGEEPVFLLRILNAGPVPAENVGVFIEVTYIYGSTKQVRVNLITIPANGFRQYDFRTFFKLPPNLADLEKWNLTLKGTVTYNGREIPLCYKYNYWHSGVRPAAVPQFVPCDFDDRRNVTVVAQLGNVSAYGSIGTVTAKSEGPEAADGGKTDESKPDGES